MSIQGNINQALSLAGLLYSQSPTYKSAQEGREYQNRQVQAIRGLEDIDKNLRRLELSTSKSLTDEQKKELEKLGGEKFYNEEELENIGSRTKQYQKDIYDAKSAALNPSLRKYITADEIDQGELSYKLFRINEMKKRALESVEASNLQRAAFNKLNAKLNGEPELKPGTIMHKGKIVAGTPDRSIKTATMSYENPGSIVKTGKEEE